MLNGKKDDERTVSDKPLRTANESKAGEEKPAWGMGTLKTSSKEK